MMTMASPIRRRRPTPFSPLPLLLPALLLLLPVATGKTVHEIDWAFDMADRPVLEVNVGDTLRIAWTGTGQYDHNVLLMASGSCDETTGEDELLSDATSNGEVTYEITNEDAAPGGKEVAFACTYDNHCRKNGMLLLLKAYPPGCSICGEGKRVGDPDAFASRKNETTCGGMEVAARRGDVPLALCGRLDPTLCACESVPTAAPTGTPEVESGEGGEGEGGGEGSAATTASASLGTSLAAAGALLVLGRRAA